MKQNLLEIEKYGRKFKINSQQIRNVYATTSN